ncbi:MAG: hypothetical protein WA958_17630 [Tunicatimonas sp.]
MSFLKRLFTRPLRARSKSSAPGLEDLDRRPIAPGDLVRSLRYDLGVCEIIITEKGIAYRSEEDGREVGDRRAVGN